MPSLFSEAPKLSISDIDWNFGVLTSSKLPKELEASIIEENGWDKEAVFSDQARIEILTGVVKKYSELAINNKVDSQDANAMKTYVSSWSTSIESEVSEYLYSAFKLYALDSVQGWTFKYKDLEDINTWFGLILTAKKRFVFESCCSFWDYLKPSDLTEEFFKRVSAYRSLCIFAEKMVSSGSESVTMDVLKLLVDKFGIKADSPLRHLVKLIRNKNDIFFLYNVYGYNIRYIIFDKNITELEDKITLKDLKHYDFFDLDDYYFFRDMLSFCSTGGNTSNIFDFSLKDYIEYRNK